MKVQWILNMKKPFLRQNTQKTCKKVSSMIRQRNKWINNTYLKRFPLKTTYIETAFIMAKNSLGSNE